MTIRKSLGLIAAVLSLTLMVSNGHAGRAASAVYSAGAIGDVGSAVGLTVCEGKVRGIPGSSLGDDNMAAGCFEVLAGESSATITVADNTFERVGFSVDYIDPGNHHMGPVRSGCGSTIIPIPANVAAIVVHVEGGVYSSANCLEASSATAGTIRVTFA